MEPTQNRSTRAKRYARFLRELIGLHPKLFATSVGGAFLFALCTVASSIAIRWVIDNVVVPRFEEGDVATSTVVAGCAFVIVIGVLRAVGVVIRRGFSHITMWRSADYNPN